jgi:FtsZ-binding cell division protein ZapB
MSAAEDRPAEGGGMGKDEVLAIIDADKDAAFYHRDDSIGFHAADRAEQKSIAARATVESLFAEVERLKAENAELREAFNDAQKRLTNQYCRDHVRDGGVI